MLDDELMWHLAEAVAKQRGYADFYHWHDKRQKELGILEAFAEAADRTGILLSGTRLAEDGCDPPDAWGVFEDRTVAFEFTELVDRVSVQEQRRTCIPQWRHWGAQEVKDELCAILRRKDHVGFGREVMYWLVIHCDEPALGHDTLTRYLQGLEPLPSLGIARCFLLLSYYPTITSYPLLEVSLKKSA